MPYEVFNRKTAGRSTVPNITIQKRGTFSINSAAAKLLSGGKEFTKLPIELLYDKEIQGVGLRSADEEAPNVYYLRKQESSESYILSGQAFTAYYGIDTSVSRRYRAKLNEEGVLGFRLDDPHVEVERTGRPPKNEFAAQDKATTA
jgi:hypothetical protein